MMKKSTVFWLSGILFFSLNSCSDDEVSAPPASAITVDVTSGFTGETEFTFTVDQVTANSIAIWPEGIDSNQPGVAVTSFTSGKATVVYKYSNVGVFTPVVVTTNFNKSGSSESTVTPYSGTVSISSKANKITSFNFGVKTEVENTGGNVFTWSQKSIRTVIKDKADADSDTITVTVPFDFYGGTGGRNAMIAQFSSSSASAVTAGATNQQSEISTNSWATIDDDSNPNHQVTDPVTYTVTSHNGDVRTYLVYVIQIRAGDQTKVSSISAKTKSKGFVDKVFPGFADSLNQKLVIYAPYGTGVDKLDSLSVNTSLSSSFSKLKYGATILSKDTMLNLTSSKVYQVIAQDGTTRDYDLYSVVAPKLTVTFGALEPVVSKGSNENFIIEMNVLNGTTISALNGTFDIDIAGGTTAAITVWDKDGNSLGSTTDGNSLTLDFSKATKVTVAVNDPTAGDYTASFSINVKVIP